MSTDNLNPIAVANAVRERRGMSSIDSGRIEGFGDNDAPAPSFENPFPPAPAELLELQENTHTYSEAPTTQQVAYVPTSTVEVWYQGNRVAYNEALHGAVERLILMALQKEVAAKLKDLAKPRRAKAKASEAPKLAAPAATKRRGRPKGSPNKPKVVPDERPVESDEVPS